MLTLLPRHTPPLSILMADLGLSPRSMARHLGVSERSVYRWMAEDHAPRAVLLSLFFASRWGVSLVCRETENAARLWSGMARCLMEDRGSSRVASIEAPAANSDQFARSVPRLVVNR